jgi:cytochrome c553
MKFALPLAAALLAASPLASFAAAPGNAKAAEPIVTQLCAACHNMDGNSAIAANPNLAGMNAEYLYKQLGEFKSGTRTGTVMPGMVASLSDDDMKNLAAYFSGQKAKPATAQDQALALAGQKIFRGGVQGAGVPACASCHGAQGQGIPVQFPRLAGQHSEYVYGQLNAFRVGERANDAARMMRTIAEKMTDADMKAVSAYIQGLR